MSCVGDISWLGPPTMKYLLGALLPLSDTVDEKERKVEHFG